MFPAGDIVIQRENFTFYAPIGTGILNQHRAFVCSVATQPIARTASPRRRRKERRGPIGAIRSGSKNMRERVCCVAELSLRAGVPSRE
ncbi:DUF2905 domain-containing protein [Mesorhizobium sp. M0965]|uniref:DUF2905 domain-containing protein n=1 Tax=unclassified Mesorhizobium TaxID=325217 RepID=UPI00333CE177